MTTKQIILTDKAPAPIPVLSQGVVVNGIVYCSGQIATDPATGKIVEGSVGDRTVCFALFLLLFLISRGAELSMFNEGRCKCYMFCGTYNVRSLQHDT